LITNCHVSEKPKIGPLIAQTAIITTAVMKAQGEPTISEVLFANQRNILFMARLLIY
jgi:hypothetical protein